MRRTEEQWGELANEILRGDVDLEVLNDRTDVSGLQVELARIRAENERLREKLGVVASDDWSNADWVRDFAKEALK